MKINKISLIPFYGLLGLVFCVKCFGHSFNSDVIEKYNLGEKVTFDKIEFIDNTNFSLKDYLGEKYILLFSWSYYFSDYAMSLEMINRLHKVWDDNDVVFLGINFDANKDKLEKTIKKYSVKFRNTYNPYITFPSKLLGTMPQDISAVIIINKKGEISFAWTFCNEQDYQDVDKYLRDEGLRNKEAK